MKSMTGFGQAVADLQDFSVSIDLSSVNKKGFELSISLPRDWMSMERLIAQELKKTVARGKIHASIKVELKDGAKSFLLDEEKIRVAVDKLRAICEKLSVKFEPTPELILKINDEMCSEKDSSKWEDSWNAILPVFSEAFIKLDEMRITEGKALEKDLSMRLQSMFEMVSEVERLSKGTVEKYKESLLQRLDNLGLAIDINDERVLKEVCIFADKCDICEEITRLNSHINHFLSTMKESDAIGRKMDFICQEMGREINTIASKANSIELTKITIELKNENERIREQTQNIE